MLGLNLIVSLPAVVLGATAAPSAPQIAASTRPAATALYVSSPAGSSSPTTAHELWRAPDGLFYVDARINGQLVRFVVDTGASMIVLTAEDARRVGATPGGGAGYVADTANGARAMAPVTLDEIEVAGRRAGAVRAAVAPAGLSVSLLGQSWLAVLDTMTIEGDRMTLQ